MARTPGEPADTIGIFAAASSFVNLCEMPLLWEMPWPDAMMKAVSGELCTMDHSFSTLPLAVALLISAGLFLAAQPQHFVHQTEVAVDLTPFCSDVPACRAQMEKEWRAHPWTPRRLKPAPREFKPADPNWDRALMRSGLVNLAGLAVTRY
jgi:hypothetical protein